MMKFFKDNKNYTNRNILRNKDINKDINSKEINTKEINTNRKTKRKTILKFIAIGIILFGVLFTTINLVKYAKGFFAYQSNVNENKSDESKSFNKKESSTNTTDDKYSLDSTTEELIKQKKLEKDQEEQALYNKRPEIGDEIGELYIPKLDATLSIFQGTNEDELDKGVGHYADSVLPGEKDNCVLSGHRDTVFRKLGEVGVGDKLIVKTSAGEFEYTVNKVRIVDKDDRTVIVPKPKAILTVSTCYPFRYIGSAPKRYILIAYLSSKTLY